MTTRQLERIDELRARHRQEAVRRGINPRDVDVLLGDLAGQSLPHLLAHGDERVDAAALEKLLGRRYAGEPLQYIRGKAEFFTREFLVDDRVLIPRPETELVVEAAVERAPRGGRVIDIGTGSGCIAISIERERPDLHVIGVDVSVAALAVAAKNRARLQAEIALAASDVLAAVRGKFDLIVSNPPYIPKKDIAGLQTEVRDHEPHLALTAGTHGTEVIARILDDGQRLLRSGGRVIIEIGFGQEKDLRELAEAKSFEVETIVPDLAAIPRVIVLSAHA
ncbi:MAG TPA: peptide chain release factor N(5)-glutamine methyltransferase [Thermoanaerobaculia bacterium]|nr:peptide chain release factor N(5)-glutamine methyltransferase [Thermoanaerobaculia bacterium]